MKKNLTYLIVFLLSFTAIHAQNVPVTFEDGENGADWTWKVFENDDDPALEIVDNPDKNVNTSNKVAKFTARAAGQPFAGCETQHGADIGEYKITAANSIITIMVHKPVISDVGIKLVTATGWSKGELKVANTKTNEWEEITFDFSTVDHEDMTYDQIVVFPDFKDRSDDHTIYFDNITIGDKVVNNVKDLNADLEFSVYPNPATGTLNINNTRNLAIETIVISNSQGQQVLTVEGKTQNISISDLTAGFYSVEIITESGIQNTRLVIK